MVTNTGDKKAKKNILKEKNDLVLIVLGAE